jgi:hypothetical protein
VNQYLDDRAEAATTLENTDCPFDTYSYYDQVSGVKWSITEYPDVEVTADSSGQLAVSSTVDWDGLGSTATFSPHSTDF